MEHSKLSIYENINIQKPSISKRSVLYPLEPIGIGTPNVENFTSYINRNALKHNISIRDLFTKIIIGMYESKSYSNISYICRLWETLGSMNSKSDINCNTVQIFMKLTTRMDLKYSTFSSLRSLSCKDVFSKTKRFCPMCYEDQMLNNDEIYEPLIWTFKVVEICPIHNIFLESKCINKACKDRIPFLKSYLVPGYCPSCKEWLGSNSYSEADDEVIKSQQWVTKQIEDILIEIPSLSIVSIKQNINKYLKSMLKEYGNNVMRSLSKILGLHRKTIEDWYSQKSLPCFNTLFKICFKLNISLLCILKYGTIEEFSIDNENLEVNFKKNTYKTYDFDKGELKRKLEGFLNDGGTVPLSLNKITQELGIPYRTLKKIFPNTCHQICNRRRIYISERSRERKEKLCKEVKEKTMYIYKMGDYPSLNKVSNLCSGKAIFWYKEVYEAWKNTMKELGL